MPYSCQLALNHLLGIHVCVQVLSRIPRIHLHLFQWRHNLRAYMSMISPISQKILGLRIYSDNFLAECCKIDFIGIVD
jgi:hypothetical protein